MKHVIEIAEVLDVNSFAFLVVVDVKHDSSLFAFAKYFCVAHEVIGADDFAVLNEPIDDFRCGHGFAKIEFVVEYHDVGVPKLLFIHLNHSIVSVSGAKPIIEPTRFALSLFPLWTRYRFRYFANISVTS